jgi:UDP-N-acetylmuramyl pentapeptide synthase
VGAVGAFVPAFEALGPSAPRVVTAVDAEDLGPKLRAALQGNEVVLLKASRGVALERVLRHLQ